MIDHKSIIKSKIDNKSIVFAVFGVGYVGIPLAQAISNAGCKVIGFDIDEDRVDKLNSSISPIKQIKDEEIEEMILNGFEATTDFSRTSDCDFLIICVPTPLSLHREPDLTAIRATMQSIQPYLKPGQGLALESTTWPGTTNEVLKPYIVDRGLSIGEDFFLVYSPEREDPGNVDFDTKSVPKIVAGMTAVCSEVGVAAYQKIVNSIVPVSSTQTAEMVKLVENIHRSVNIGLVNELKKICDAMAIDIFDVIDAAATKPFGFTPYYPGPGIGGHCIPID
ncbi:MAG: nucleotide sugar dehydrogenase, partial [Paracoccaceae bacterium]